MKLRISSLLAGAIFCACFGVSAGGAQAPLAAAAPPALPGDSPVKLFRDLLGMKAEDRERALAERFNAQRRTVIESKLREYESLPAAEREARLAATELRWYFPVLMRQPPGARAEAVAAIPEPARQLVSERLSAWDRLSPELQKEARDNDSALQYFLRGESRAAAALTNAAPPLPSDPLEQKLTEWRARPKDERVKLYRNFHQFFALSAQDKQRAVAALNGPERERAQESLKAFGAMRDDDRVAYIEALRKFVNMPASDQSGFLDAAERWKKMTPQEKALWRTLVKVSPPSLPGTGLFATNALPSRPPPEGGAVANPPVLPGGRN